MRKKAPKKERKEGQTVSTWMSQDLVDRIDKLADKGGITRSRMITNMVELSVNGLERADKLGVLSFAILMRDFENDIKAWFCAVRDEGDLIKKDYENGDMNEYSWDEL